jgi:type VI secretion system protein ImpA
LTELAFLAAPDDDDAVAMPAVAAVNVAIVDPTISSEPRVDAAAQPIIIDPAVTAPCARLSDTDPCGPDLDLAGDADYLNFFAQTEGVLPTSFFSSDDGKPFDRASVDLRGSVDAIGPLWERSRDLRLLVMRARLLILDRDLGGFAVSISAIAQWLDQFWNDINPRADGEDFGARVAALGALDLPTVVFPLQYAPLCEGRRIEAVTYRAWMIAVGEVKPRPGEQKHSSAALTEAVADAPTGTLAATRAHVAMIKASLGRIREIFMTKGCSPGLETLAAQVDKLQAFIDPRAVIEARAAAPTAQSEELSTPSKDRNAGAIADSPASLAEAQQALAAISDYYSRSEPSSPTLPLVRQAHQLIGKSFFEVMSILVPTQMEKAAFQIGAAEFFELPVGKLSKAAGVAPPSPEVSGEASPTANPEHDDSPQYRIESRAQAIAMLEQVQRFFRHAEPSSPVPMLCDRARALAERDFMGVLREVLPKAALKSFDPEK